MAVKWRCIPHLFLKLLKDIHLDKSVTWLGIKHVAPRYCVNSKPRVYPISAHEIAVNLACFTARYGMRGDFRMLSKHQ